MLFLQKPIKSYDSYKLKPHQTRACLPLVCFTFTREHYLCRIIAQNTQRLSLSSLVVISSLYKMFAHSENEEGR